MDAGHARQHQLAPPVAAPFAPPEAAPFAPPEAAPFAPPEAAPFAPPEAAPYAPPEAAPYAPLVAAQQPQPIFVPSFAMSSACLPDTCYHALSSRGGVPNHSPTTPHPLFDLKVGGLLESQCFWFWMCGFASVFNPHNFGTPTKKLVFSFSMLRSLFPGCPGGMT